MLGHKTVHKFFGHFVDLCSIVGFKYLAFLFGLLINRYNDFAVEIIILRNELPKVLPRVLVIGLVRVVRVNLQRVSILAIDTAINGNNIARYSG